MIGVIIFFTMAIIGLMWICLWLFDRKEAVEIELYAWRRRYSKMEYDKRWGVIVDKMNKEN